MIDLKDLKFSESQNNFDVKAFLFKLLAYWKWIVLFLIIAFFIAYQINIRKEKIYAQETLISIQYENNNFFTSNTSLVFNWGGVSDKIQSVITTLKSRTHNEIVVDKLGLYVDYFTKEKYYNKDIYGSQPFVVVIDKSKPQLINVPVKITFITANQFWLEINFENKNLNTLRYFDNYKGEFTSKEERFKKKFQLGQPIQLPFLNLTLVANPKVATTIDKPIYFKVNNFDDVVAHYKDIDAEPTQRDGSIIKIQAIGTNKTKLVDYLNTTVSTLIQNQLNKKNEYAQNTINFIDSTLYRMESELAKAEDELKDFRKKSDVIELESGSKRVFEKLSAYDIEKDLITRKIANYNNLKNYLEKNTDFSKLPAPTVVGIDDINIVSNVSELIALSKTRSDKEYTTKNKNVFNALDAQIESIRKVLLENISSSKFLLTSELQTLNVKINQSEATLARLPEEQQNLLNITRKYNLKDNIYITFLQKRSEAEIIKASNLSDVSVIDTAKDVGGNIVGPKTNINYILALLLGLLLPILVISMLILLDNGINTPEDITKLTSIPVLGVVGKKTSESNLAVFERPKSTLAESFRALRSSLQYLYKKQNLKGSKTVMLTSSVSGEGKTFCSVNLASVFALSEKKTIIVGLDLRKPRIFGDFKINNIVGVVNYLIDQKTVDEIIQKSHIPYLDVITSGPIPPNPSELLMSDSMKDLIDELKQRYDYIILDTPPVGLVSDALELSEYCDATLYVVRQGHTKKGMLEVINEKHKRGELHNISIILNGFENKAKYGYGGYGGYGSYGYGSYGKGYHEEELVNETFLDKIKNKIKKLITWMSKR